MKIGLFFICQKVIKRELKTPPEIGQCSSFEKYDTDRWLHSWILYPISVRYSDQSVVKSMPRVTTCILFRFAEDFRSTWNRNMFRTEHDFLATWDSPYDFHKLLDDRMSTKHNVFAFMHGAISLVYVQRGHLINLQALTNLTIKYLSEVFFFCLMNVTAVLFETYRSKCEFPVRRRRNSCDLHWAHHTSISHRVSSSDMEKRK